MAFDCSWLAYHAVPKAEVVALAGFRDTGIGTDVPDGPACAALSNGWTIFYVPDSTWTLERMAQLSADHAVLSVMIQEYVPLSMASFHVRAEPIWTVEHDGARGVFNLGMTGNMPPEFEPIRRRLIAKQQLAGTKSVDHLFDAPVDLAAAICGFRHNQAWFKEGEPAFTEAVPA